MCSFVVVMSAWEVLKTTQKQSTARPPKPHLRDLYTRKKNSDPQGPGLAGSAPKQAKKEGRGKELRHKQRQKKGPQKQRVRPSGRRAEAEEEEVE